MSTVNLGTLNPHRIAVAEVSSAAVGAVVAALLHTHSQWCAVTPLPDDRFAVAVKVENAALLALVIPEPKPSGAELPAGWRKRVKYANELDDDECDACGLELNAGAALNSTRMLFYSDADDERRACSPRCAREWVERRNRRRATA